MTGAASDPLVPIEIHLNSIIRDSLRLGASTEERLNPDPLPSGLQPDAAFPKESPTSAHHCE